VGVCPCACADTSLSDILLDHLGVVKFVDFGAAKILAKNSRTVQRSRRPGVVGPGGVGADGKPGVPGVPGAMGSLQGTPMYMSPEVIKGDNRGRRGAMDVWSLGCVVLEFATGRRPWSQLDNEWAIMFHIGMAQQHPPLPEPGQLSELGIDFIRQCLIIDPYDRPSAAEMRDHPWIQNLVDELNAANEEEGEWLRRPDYCASLTRSPSRCRRRSCAA
jgi:mitogen-activated protein kinase kinase kinase